MARKKRDPIRVSAVTERVTSTGHVSGFQVEAWHDGLNEHRVLSDRDIGVLNNKLDAQLARWAEKYDRRLEREQRDAQRQAGREAAERETKEAQEALQACRDILRHTLDVDDRVDWKSLKSHAPMIREPKRTKGIEYDPETGKPVSYRPSHRQSGSAPVYKPPHFNILDHIFSSMRDRKEEEARTAFRRALKKWQDESDKEDREDTKAPEYPRFGATGLGSRRGRVQETAGFCEC